MPVATLDQQQRSRAEPDPFPIDDGDARAGFDKEPLVCAAVAIVRSPFAIAWFDGHRRGLGAPVAERDPEAFPEP